MYLDLNLATQMPHAVQQCPGNNDTHKSFDHLAKPLNDFWHLAFHFKLGRIELEDWKVLSDSKYEVKPFKTQYQNASGETTLFYYIFVK